MAHAGTSSRKPAQIPAFLYGTIPAAVPIMRRLVTMLLMLCAGCTTSVNSGDCEDDTCECEGDSCEPVCPLDCRRPGDPAECGDPCDPPPDCELPPDLAPFETGTGEVCFERLGEDGVVSHFEGPQGGYHLFLALTCSDCAGEVVVETTARQEDNGAEVSPLTQSSVAMKGVSATGIIVPMPGSPWDPESPPLAEGTRLLLNTVVKSMSGEELHNVEELRVVGPSVVWDYCATHPEDQCCIELCDGI